MKEKYNAHRGENKEEFDLTMQQKFNFDSNELDEEDTKTYKIKKNQAAIRNKREKELIKLKNLYKRKFTISLIVAFVLFFFCVISVMAYIFVKPKEKIKVEKQIPERVVFIGDSLTWMYDLKKHYSSEIYKDKYYLVNSGMDGSNTEQIIYNIKNRIYQFNPSKVFLLIGTNDINQHRGKDEIVNNIEKIINKIKENNPKCKIYLESLYPINNTDDSRINMEMVGYIRNNDLINEINKDLEELSEKQKITYINIHDLLLDEERNLKLEYTIEGLHITEEGYDVITKKLKEYL